MITSMCPRLLLYLLCTQYSRSRCIYKINRSEKSPAGYLVCGGEQEMISSWSITTAKIARWSNNLAHFKQSSKFAEVIKLGSWWARSGDIPMISRHSLPDLSIME